MATLSKFLVRAALALVVAGCSSPSAPEVEAPSTVGAGTWSLIASAYAQGSDLPLATSARHGSAVWTGTDMFLWSGIVSAGFRYDPRLDRWAALPKVKLQEQELRGNAAFVAISEHRVALWGGTGCSEGFAGPCTNSAIYDADSDRWSPISTINAPSARAVGTGVWTGSRMLVWGGWVYIKDSSKPVYHTKLLADGGLYDVNTDSWSSIASDPLAPPRMDHSSVWTGSKLILWGGLIGEYAGGSVPTNTGSIYDPETNRWTAMTLTGAASPRSQHMAVWTGSEMLVWGGSCGETSDLNEWTLCTDGAAYDPGSDRWRPISNTGAPQARGSSSAVWSGQHMLVWGGGAAESFGVNWGARYDVATDSWQPITTVGAPHGRMLHWAFWTGDRMLIWGGCFDLNLFDDGGFYTP